MWERIKSWFLPWDQLKIIHRLWTVRIALIGAVLDGAYVAIPVFQQYVSPIQFGLLCIGLSVTLVIARITNQTGVDF